MSLLLLAKLTASFFDPSSACTVCSYNSLPSELTREFRNYLLETRKATAAVARNTIYKKLSPFLELKASKIINQSLMDYQCFSRVRRLPKGEAFISAIVMAMKPKVFVPKEDVPVLSFYLITQGSVKRIGNILSPGDYFGAGDVILTDPKKSKSAMRPAFATTYLHVQAIHRREFQVLKESYPMEYAASACPHASQGLESQSAARITPPSLRHVRATSFLTMNLPSIPHTWPCPCSRSVALGALGRHAHVSARRAQGLQEPVDPAASARAFKPFKPKEGLQGSSKWWRKRDIYWR